MKKLKMQSRDAVGANVEKIAALFPQCVTECRVAGRGTPRPRQWQSCSRHTLLSATLPQPTTMRLTTSTRSSNPTPTRKK